MLASTQPRHLSNFLSWPFHSHTHSFAHFLQILFLPRHLWPYNTLSDLFTRDDTRKTKRSYKPNSEVKVCGDDDDANEETETVKEFIDLEILKCNKRNAARDSKTFWNGDGSTSQRKTVMLTIVMIIIVIMQTEMQRSEELGDWETLNWRLENAIWGEDLAIPIWGFQLILRQQLKAVRRHKGSSNSARRVWPLWNHMYGSFLVLRLQILFPQKTYRTFRSHLQSISEGTTSSTLSLSHTRFHLC